MAGNEKSKLKLLHLADIFHTMTDEEHPMTAADICAELNRRDISAERKSIYRDIEVLREFGMDIVNAYQTKNGYFLASRTFELAELRLLEDAVLAAGFISGKKSAELVGKIGSMASCHQAAMLKNQVYVDSRSKSCNEEIYYIIDMMTTAINSGKQVRFVYQKKKIVSGVAKIEKREFTVSPYALIWSDDRYYLVCNYSKYDNLMHLRIDRMKKPEILQTPARHFSEVSRYKTAFNSADYVNSIFNMYSGEPKSVELHCENALLEIILDRFGEKTRISYVDESHFAVNITAVLGDGLTGWLMQFGSGVEVIRPTSLRAEIAEKTREMMTLYGL